MNIVFLTLGYPKNPKDKNLYTDLMKSLKELGNTVTVYRQNEERKGIHIEIIDGIKIINVYTGRITKTSFIKKGINLLLIKKRFIRAIKRNTQVNFDVLLYSTPPITFAGIISILKKHYKCTTYLLLKDIFPQNAVDLQLMKKVNPIYLYFRKMEKILYKQSDLIGCMSPENVNYLLHNNSFISDSKVHISPNCLIPSNDIIPPEKQDSKLKLIYGGNLGKPQGIDFLLLCMNEIENYENINFTIVGSGTEYSKIENFITNNNIKKTKLISYLPNSEYIRLLSTNDMGMIFLDERFTIPNFPSRILDYANNWLPVFAVTDTVSDVKQQICDKGAGVWIKSGDITAFKNTLTWLLENKNKIPDMKKHIYSLLKDNYNAMLEAKNIISRIEKVRNK